MKEYFHHNYGCHHRTMQSCDCSRDSCSSNPCCCSHGGHQDKCGGNSHHHHNYGCHHRTMQSCDCSRDSCSSNPCCCSHGGHQDNYAVNPKKGSKFMLEKAFYRALMEDQVERIKDIILDDDEQDDDENDDDENDDDENDDDENDDEKQI